MTRGAKVAVALLIVFVVGVMSGFMYLVTTMLFHFAGGQARMGRVVDYGALAVIASMMLLAAIVWKVRSPAAAGIRAVIATPVACVAAAFVEWRLGAW
jgi:hypothetical protein